MGFKYILHCNAVLHNMSTRPPVPMEHDPARFKLSLMDLFHSNRFIAAEKHVFGSFSYYYHTYGVENMKKVILVIPSGRGGIENKEGFICLGRSSRKNVFFIVTMDTVQPVYDIEGAVETFMGKITSPDRCFIYHDHVDDTSTIKEGGREFSDVIFKDSGGTQFTVKKLYVQ